MSGAGEEIRRFAPVRYTARADPVGSPLKGLHMPATRRALKTFAMLIGLSILGLVGGSLIVGGAAVESRALVSSQAQVSKVSRQGPYALVLVIDAARFDQLDIAHMPNLANLVAAGTTYTRAWVGQLPSITETSHATIGTGVLPYRHLILGETWRVPGKNQMSPNLLSSQLDRTGYIGKFIKATGSPNLASFVHQRYPGSIVVSLSGHKVYAADAMGAAAADFVAFGGWNNRGHYAPAAIPGHTPSQSILESSQLDLSAYPRNGTEDSWTTTLAEKFLFKYHPRLMMVNWPEVDVNGHVLGTTATVMQPFFANIDHQLGRLIAAYGRAGMLEQTYFVITSDHAMIPAVHTIWSKRIDQIVVKAGGVPLYIGHGDYCPIYLKNLSAIPKVAVALANANIPNVDAVYAKTGKGAYTLVSPLSRLADPAVAQAYSDLLASFNSSESPDIVLLYDENTITMTPEFFKVGRKGDHSGATWGSQHIPLILAGPGIKQDFTSWYPARMVDIAPTVEMFLGMRPQHQDGVPLADAMLHPSSWATSMQNKVQARLSADVDGLEREAAARPNISP